MELWLQFSWGNSSIALFPKIVSVYWIFVEWDIFGYMFYEFTFKNTKRVRIPDVFG